MFWKVFIMHYLGFNIAWINGVSCLYRNAHSQVLLVGGEDLGNITRSLCQRCSLAPFLFLLFVEAMHIFLSTQSMGLRGLAMPIS